MGRSSPRREVTRAPPSQGGSGRSLLLRQRRRLIRRSTLNRRVRDHHHPPRPSIASLPFLHSAATAAARGAGTGTALIRASVARAITIMGSIECLTHAVRETCKRGTKRRRSSRKRPTTLTKRATTNTSISAVVSSSTTRGISSERDYVFASTTLASRGGARALLYHPIVPSCTRPRFSLLHVISATCTLRNGRCRFHELTCVPYLRACMEGKTTTRSGPRSCRPARILATRSSTPSSFPATLSTGAFCGSSGAGRRPIRRKSRTRGGRGSTRTRRWQR